MSQTLSQLIRIAGHRRAADDRAQQDDQHDHGPGDESRSCRFSSRSSSRTTSRAPRSSSTCRSSRSIAQRTKSYGLNLTRLRHRRPLFAGRGAGRRRDATRHRQRDGTPEPATGPGAPATSTPPGGVTSPPPFNLNTITRGVSTADFYLAVPTAIVRFLETDTHTKVVAKPQLRGRGGQQAVAESRSEDSGRLDQLHADCDRRRRREPAELVYVSGRRRQHRHDAARLARRRDHPRPDPGQQRARPGQGRRRRDGADLRAAQADDAPAPARRRVQPARRADRSSGTRTSSRDFPARSTCRSSSRSSRATTSRAIRPRSSCCSRRASCARRS